jgi:mRNA interferase RelE/StbE
VRYELAISEKALQQLRALPKPLRQRIGWRIDELQDGLKGDVLKLQAKGNMYRLRVGNFRILFLLEGALIKVYAVKDRKQAYE